MRPRRAGCLLETYFDRAGVVDLLEAQDEVRLAQTIEAGRAAAAELATGRPAPDRRADLAAAVAGGEAARERFVAANLRLVVHLALRHPAPPAVDLADLIQDGNVGLIEAVDRYDWRRGYRFSTYAAWWIRQAIQRGTASSHRTIRLPYPLHEAVLRVGAARERLRSLTGHEPSVLELSLATRLDRTMVERALRVPPDALSLHRPLGGDQSTGRPDLSEFVAVAADSPADEVTEHLAFATALQAARTRLDERSRLVLFLRFGLDGGEPLSYEAIAAEIGMSRESVRLILKRALAVLRAALGGDRSAEQRALPRLPRVAQR